MVNICKWFGRGSGNSVIIVIEFGSWFIFMIKIGEIIFFVYIR